MAPWWYPLVVFHVFGIIAGLVTLLLMWADRGTHDDDHGTDDDDDDGWVYDDVGSYYDNRARGSSIRGDSGTVGSGRERRDCGRVASPTFHRGVRDGVADGPWVIVP
jgi:hypothetical protein